MILCKLDLWISSDSIAKPTALLIYKDHKYSYIKLS